MHRRVGRSAGLIATLAALMLAPALAADIPPPDSSAPVNMLSPARVDSFRDRFEFRFGVGAHGVGSVESGSVDLNPEIVFPQLPLFGLPADPAWAWIVPRFHLGGMINLAGRTSFGYAGLVWTYQFINGVFVEGFFGGAVHNGSLAGNPAAHEAALGCRGLFHAGASIGYRINPQLSLMATFDHISNGNAALDVCSRNQGLNEYLIRAGYSF
jgi:hypothetical protein